MSYKKAVECERCKGTIWWNTDYDEEQPDTHDSLEECINELGDLVKELIQKNSQTEESDAELEIVDHSWYQDDEFDEQLPDALANEIARFYGRGEVAIDFAQMLAAFYAVDECRAVLVQVADQDSKRNNSDSGNG